MPREKTPDSEKKRSTRRRAAAPVVQVVQVVPPVPEVAAPAPNFVDPQHRTALIARAAYLRALNRGFEPGHEGADWLAAEAEVDAELLRGTAAS